MSSTTFEAGHMLETWRSRRTSSCSGLAYRGIKLLLVALLDAAPAQHPKASEDR